MKAYDITELIAELKSRNIQYRNKTIYITVVLFWCRRPHTGSAALTPYWLQASCVRFINENKLLCCRKEAARWFMSSNILLNHPRSFEMTLLS